MSVRETFGELAGEDYFLLPELDGYNYKFYYPSGEDLLKAQELDEKLEGDQTRLESIMNQVLLESDAGKRKSLLGEAEIIKEKLKSERESLLDWCCHYIKSEDDKAPDFKKTLLSHNVRYLLVFMKIVKEKLDEV